MTAYGASSSLRPIAAKVASPNRQWPLRLGRENWSSCPFAVIEGAIRRRVPRLHSNTLWAPFDKTKSRLGGRERYVVGQYRLGEALQSERANLFGYDASLQCDIDALAEQNLPVLGLGTKT
jgi:hypothetical protein